MNAGRTQEIFTELLKDLGTNITGHLLAFDTDTQLAQVQIGVLGVDTDGNTITPSPIIECPVHFSGGSDWHFEHKISPNDEGLIVFSQRCIDGWIQTGGVANNPIARFHDKQDACFIPGFRSKSNAISDFSNNGVKLRNKDNSVYHWIKDDGTIESKNTTASHTIMPTGAINSVNAAGFITLLDSGIVSINGFTVDPTGAAVSPVSVSGPTLVASTSLTVAGKEQADHTHEAGTYKVGSTDVVGISGVQP